MSALTKNYYEGCKSRPATGAVKGPILGPLVALPNERERQGHILAKLTLDEDRTAKYIERLSRPLDTDSLNAGPARKLSGQIEWTESVATQRHLRAFIWPIREQERLATSGSLSPALRSALAALRTILADYPERIVHSSALRRRYRVAFTDARGRAKPTGDSTWGFEHIGGVVFCA